MVYVLLYLQVSDTYSSEISLLVGFILNYFIGIFQAWFLIEIGLKLINFHREYRLQTRGYFCCCKCPSKSKKWICNTVDLCDMGNIHPTIPT